MIRQGSAGASHIALGGCGARLSDATTNSSYELDFIEVQAPGNVCGTPQLVDAVFGDGGGVRNCSTADAIPLAMAMWPVALAAKVPSKGSVT